eukprot:jgi/Tetstr1/454833/TSEL_041713.t1
MLAKEASEQSPCCSRKCVHKLYTQCGEALVDAVLDRALTVYSGNQNRSFDRLAQVLRGGYESASDKFDYMFDHGGYLRSFDHRGPIYTCGRAWEVLHQVSKHRRLVIQRSVVDNEPTYIRQRKQYESRQTGPREHVRMFLEHFFSDDLGHVEIMPFHDGNSETFKKHLPPWMTKICVYYYYKSWAEDDNAILRGSFFFGAILAVGSGASDTTVTLPLCSCRSGYSCDCDARASDRKEPEKRKYTWGKGCDEVAESGNGKVSSLISKRTSRDCIRLMLAKEASEQSPCCSRKCVHKLYTQCGEALVDAVLDRALTVYSGNQNRSFDRLAQVLRGGYESASDKFDYMFDHGGYLRSFDHRGPIYTCGRAWEVLHQVSKHRRLVIQRSVVDNEPTYIRQRKQYESRQTGPREHVRMFLEHFFSDDLGHVEIMPFHDGNSETFKKHLPPWMTKICVYYYYKSWAEDDNAILRDLATESEVKLASFDTFRRTWKEDFPDVTTPKVKRFSHCPICAAGKALRDQAREICTKDMTPEERQVHRQHQQLVRRQVRAEQKVHLERVRQERRDLNNAVFQSRLGHGNFFFFEIDSMDSAKTLLPHWVRIPKTVKPDMLLKYHLTCVKYDGYRPDDIYYYTNTIPHDSSTTCTLIWITIMKEIQHRGRKIPYIRIQMDNTVRENKNRNVAALCNWLVSIGICDVIHLVFLPVGHTHERVDQIFSRISLALSRSSAYTIEAFLDLVAKAFSPTPEIAELSFSLDFSEWLRPHFQDHIQDISKPHKFEFTRDDAAASGGSLRTALWSNTPLSEPVQILKSAPTGTPEIRAGRPLLYALCDKKKPDAVKVQRYLDDFKKVRSYITDLAVQWHFSPVERESWKNLLDDLDEMQTAPSAAFSGFWPQRKEEVDDFLREHGQTAPAEARHTMATNADLNNAEAARVEAEVRAQVLQDDSAFRGVHAGAKERLHDNTSPSDAKGSNLVVIDVSDTKGGKKPVDTSWEKCLTLPWKLVEAVPLSYAKAIHDASGSREVFNEDGTMVRKKWRPNTQYTCKDGRVVGVPRVGRGPQVGHPWAAASSLHPTAASRAMNDGRMCGVQPISLTY